MGVLRHWTDGRVAEVAERLGWTGPNGRDRVRRVLNEAQAVPRELATDRGAVSAEWTDEAIEAIRLSLLHDHDIPAPTSIIGTILDLSGAVPPPPRGAVSEAVDPLERRLREISRALGEIGTAFHRPAGELQDAVLRAKAELDGAIEHDLRVVKA